MDHRKGKKYFKHKIIAKWAHVELRKSEPWSQVLEVVWMCVLWERFVELSVCQSPSPNKNNLHKCATRRRHRSGATSHKTPFTCDRRGVRPFGFTSERLLEAVDTHGQTLWQVSSAKGVSSSSVTPQSSSHLWSQTWRHVVRKCQGMFTREDDGGPCSESKVSSSVHPSDTLSPAYTLAGCQSNFGNLSNLSMPRGFH